MLVNNSCKYKAGARHGRLITRIAELGEMENWEQISVWRKQQRAELITHREAVPAAQRQEWNNAMTSFLVTAFAPLAGVTIGFCWPYRNEFDARFAVRHFREHGSSAALPAVINKSSPLQFRKWWPGAPMTPGVYGIPVPEGTETVIPDAMIVPMNGFDEQGYRLGYGGGYFDMTLAAAAPRPLLIGTGYEFSRLPSIYPQPHDIAMEFIVTESGIYLAGGASLMPIDRAECAGLVRRALAERSNHAAQ